jgi:hypothetical protein
MAASPIRSVFLVSMGILGLMIFVVVRMAFPSYEVLAERRMVTLLECMKAGPDISSREETAIGIWAMNRYRILDRDQLGWASDHFDRWRRAKGLYRKTGEFRIERVERVPNSKPDTATVTFTLDGDRYRVAVPRDMPISWVD